MVAEIGTDMTRFPSAAHLSSWTGMCPGSHESAGKRRSGKIRRAIAGCAPRWWKPVAPRDALNAPHSAHAIVARAQLGLGRAVVAVGRQVLEIAYHLLREPTTYRELGTDYFEHYRAETMAP